MTAGALWQPLRLAVSLKRDGGALRLPLAVSLVLESSHDASGLASLFTLRAGLLCDKRWA